MGLVAMDMMGKQRLGLYPNLHAHWNELGWSIQELLARVENPPSEKSVRRLESGKPIRLSTVNKLFNAIAAAKASEEKLDRIVEIRPA